MVYLKEINNPPEESLGGAGFQKQYFAVCKIYDFRKVTSYFQYDYDTESTGSEIFVDAQNEYQIEGELIEIIPYPK